MHPQSSITGCPVLPLSKRKLMSEFPEIYCINLQPTIYALCRKLFTGHFLNHRFWRIIAFSFFCCKGLSGENTHQTAYDNKLVSKEKSCVETQDLTLAGAEGLEPSTKVLETHVLPLHHCPMAWQRSHSITLSILCQALFRLSGSISGSMCPHAMV